MFSFHQLPLGASAGLSNVFHFFHLEMDFSELRENRNYLFTGRAVPNQHSDDYVFMGDEMTVIEWKPSPFKSKKYLKSNRRGNCN